MKYTVIYLTILLITTYANPITAMVNGPCSNCHTMHNSQNGLVMNYDGDPAPNPFLTRGSCIGCHSQNTTEKTIITNIMVKVPRLNLNAVAVILMDDFRQDQPLPTCVPPAMFTCTKLMKEVTVSGFAILLM